VKLWRFAMQRSGACLVRLRCMPKGHRRQLSLGPHPVGVSDLTRHAGSVLTAVPRCTSRPQTKLLPPARRSLAYAGLTRSWCSPGGRAGPRWGGCSFGRKRGLFVYSYNILQLAKIARGNSSNWRNKYWRPRPLKAGEKAGLAGNRRRGRWWEARRLPRSEIPPPCGLPWRQVVQKGAQRERNIFRRPYFGPAPRLVAAAFQELA
jgi:hypothetical protein